jgi:hypothetical protein
MAIAAKLPFAFGAVLVIAGVVIPASALIGFLRTTPEALREHLFLGAALFKTGLVLHGLFIMISGWLITWKPAKQEEKRFNDRSSVFPFILTSILLTAFLLRLYNLNFGIWFDEIATYVSYMHLAFGEILTTFDNQNNHLLYTLLARLSFLILAKASGYTAARGFIWGRQHLDSLSLFLSGSDVEGRTVVRRVHGVFVPSCVV